MSDHPSSIHPSGPVVTIAYPSWVPDIADFDKTYATDAEKMQLAIAVSRADVERDRGRSAPCIRGHEMLELYRASGGKVDNG